MFGHIFVTRLKCLIRDKQLVFWSLVFPILLATLFKIAFSNLSSSEIFKAIDIAVVDNQYYKNNEGFKGAMEQVSKAGEDKLFNVTFAEEDKAEELLKNSKIEGYIYLNPDINLVVKSSGLNQTIIKSYLDNYKQIESTIAGIAKENPQAMMNTALMEDISSYKEYTKEISPSRGEPDTILNYFYSLIAMACLYGGFLGLKEITDIQADLSKRAARVNMVPVHKMKVFIYSFSAAFMVQFAQILILLGYLRFILKINFGNQLPYILLLCFVGCVVGVSMGAMISALVKKKEGMKVAILISVSMIGSILSGMYQASIKYFVEQKLPALAYINPASLITDGFYTLYYYNTHGRFFVNTFILVALSVVFCLITYYIIRRQKYASL